MDIAGKVEKNCIEYSKKINELLTEMKLENDDINFFFRKLCKFLDEFREDLKKFNGKENLVYFSTKFRVITELAEYIYFILRDESKVNSKIIAYKLMAQIKKYKSILEMKPLIESIEKLDIKEYNNEMNKIKNEINNFYKKLKGDKNFEFGNDVLEIITTENNQKKGLVDELSEQELDLISNKNWYSLCSENKTMKDLIFYNEKNFFENCFWEKSTNKKFTETEIRDEAKKINDMVNKNNNFKDKINGNNFDFKEINPIKLKKTLPNLFESFYIEVNNIIKIEKREGVDFLNITQKEVFEEIKSNLLNFLYKYRMYSILSKSVHVGNIFDNEEEEEERTLNMMKDSFNLSFFPLMWQLVYIRFKDNKKALAENIVCLGDWKMKLDGKKS